MKRRAQVRWRCGSGEPSAAVGPRRPSVPRTHTDTRVASAKVTSALVSAPDRPAPLSVAKGTPPPHPLTARERSQGHMRPDTNSAAHPAHPGCRELWLVKRQAAPDQQLRVGQPRHRRTQPTRCRVASKPNGLRLLQGACESSRSMFPLRARATRVRGVHQRFCAPKVSALAAGAAEGDDETPKGCKGLSSACGEKSRDVRCHSQTAERTGGVAAAYKLRQTLPVYRPSTAPRRLPDPWVLWLCH